ncbi:SAF domain-containing protein [Nocardia sp. CDC159]|uniref:SAF domain-containing protein n=1 Tax=Nocardia pulmonis TaxID=2951408 RepID=A0A9X2E7R9_9NOCA|nr:MULTISPECIES: SAF domain-containing protein [Nocardia]MCM6775176.1 SAF domain-containing protein [Nocardia pulmonis]MCM6789646.1 SAF domain-containing protein [Nocardia sp. CDC159]
MRSSPNLPGTADSGREPPWEFLLRHRPSRLDVTLLRRMLAALLAIGAVVLFVRGDPQARSADVVIATRDLSPGRVLSAADLRVVARPAGLLPEGSVREVSALVGATVSGAVRAGEMLTDLRVLGARLAQVATGVADARIAPIRLADNAVADILRVGDRVDVVTAERSEGDPAHAGPPRTLAADAVVVLISAPEGRRGPSGERVVLLALDSAHALDLAAGSLRTELTVLFR